MGKVNSFADIMLDWEGLIDAVERNPDLQPNVEPEWQALAQAVTEVEGIKARQLELGALRQEATQQLNDAVARGRELAIRVRSVVRGKIGPKNARLVHFNVAPLRKRPRKPKPAQTEAGESLATAPDPATVPAEP